MENKYRALFAENYREILTDNFDSESLQKMEHVRKLNKGALWFCVACPTAFTLIWVGSFIQARNMKTFSALAVDCAGACMVFGTSYSMFRGKFVTPVR